MTTITGVCIGYMLGAKTVKLWESAIGVACWCVSAGLLAESGPGQGYIQLLVVLDQGCVAVVEDQLPQRRVEVVGLSKAIPCGRPVDHAVLHIPIHTVTERTLSLWVDGRYLRVTIWVLPNLNYKVQQCKFRSLI